MQILLLLILIALVFGGQAVLYIFYAIAFIVVIILLWFALIYGVVFVLKLASGLAGAMATVVDYCIFRPSAALAKKAINIRSKAARLVVLLIFAPLICVGQYRLEHIKEKSDIIKIFPALLFIFGVASLLWAGGVLAIWLTAIEAASARR